MTRPILVSFLALALTATPALARGSSGGGSHGYSGGRAGITSSHGYRLFEYAPAHYVPQRHAFGHWERPTFHKWAPPKIKQPKKVGKKGGWFFGL